ncbi:hypothetical protein [Chryseobacterium taihuense]|uniref:Lipoprotein n=1 Tax=Chryseobacterium taihuense TaxID=1141221 RepID=A0ABY0QZY2_9FLAO|nr:hypothetical protein [Chryseobacterium taihuense]SDM16752.1 hypothetical protein SAMN05216273_11565 [Chryseobacterium taihuense]
MKTKLFTLGILYSLIACTHSAKDADAKTTVQTEAKTTNEDEIVRETITDRHGEEMEIIRNETKNTVVIRLNGKSYELHKNHENPGYSTSDSKYQFTENKKDVTFLKKDVDMVLFHGDKNLNNEKMASQ